MRGIEHILFFFISREKILCVYDFINFLFWKKKGFENRLFETRPVPCKMDIEGRSKPESTLESGSTKYRKSRGVVTFVTNCDKTVTKV